MKLQHTWDIRILDSGSGGGRGVSKGSNVLMTYRYFDTTVETTEWIDLGNIAFQVPLVLNFSDLDWHSSAP